MKGQLDLLTMSAQKPKRSRKKPNDMGETFRAQLRTLREQRGWTQQGLAKMVKVTRPAIATYEQGVAFPPLPVLQRLAHALQVSLDTLVLGQQRVADSIDDPKLLEFFQRADRLHYRAKAVLLEVVEAILLKEEQEGRLPQDKVA